MKISVITVCFNSAEGIECAIPVTRVIAEYVAWYRAQAEVAP